MQAYTWFLHRILGSKSGPCACVTNSLLTEPSPYLGVLESITGNQVWCAACGICPGYHSLEARGPLSLFVEMAYTKQWLSINILQGNKVAPSAYESDVLPF